jgi:hypothetical protein
VARSSVVIPSAFDLVWQPLPTTDGNVPGPVFKLLSSDPESGGSTILIHLPPGWRDEALDWHPCSEEGLVLAGLVTLADRRYTPGIYLYRPPGILHGPAACPSDDGATIVQRFDRELRILRYAGEEFPHRDLQPITKQYEDWPIEWVERLDPEGLTWSAAKCGPWVGARYKRLARDRVTGGGSILLELPAGWHVAEFLARGEWEVFVIDGAVETHEGLLRRWGYLCAPSGTRGAGWAAPEGARLVAWCQVDELG